MDYMLLRSFPGLVRKTIVVFHVDVLLMALQEFRRFLSTPKIQSLSAISKIHQLFVLQDGALLSYNLPVLVSVIQGKSTNETFADSVRRVSPRDQTVYLFSAGIMNDRSIGA